MHLSLLVYHSHMVFLVLTFVGERDVNLESIFDCGCRLTGSGQTQVTGASSSHHCAAALRVLWTPYGDVDLHHTPCPLPLMFWHLTPGEKCCYP